MHERLLKIVTTEKPWSFSFTCGDKQIVDPAKTLKMVPAMWFLPYIILDTENVSLNERDK